MSTSILIIDDEAGVLRAFQRLFLDYDYEIFTSVNAQEALNILENNKIDIVISDYKMPGMDGIQLLEIVKKRYPEVLRFMLSGFLDDKTILKVLQKNVAKQFFFKPWENEQFLGVINSVIGTEKILKDRNLIKLINGIEDLPTIKKSYLKVIELIEQDAESIRIAKAIEQDQAMSTKILQIANSAFFRLKTGSVVQAVVYFGLINIKNIIISTCVADFFNSNVKLGEYLEKLWEHSCLCNKIVSWVYENSLNKKVPEIASVAGLLHDVGKIILVNNYSEEYENIVKKAETGESTFLYLENELFNINHQQIGGYLLNLWGIPLPIIEAALYHHLPFDERVINKELLCAVHLADYYAMQVVFPDHNVNFDEGVFNYLDISKTEFEKNLHGFLENNNI